MRVSICNTKKHNLWRVLFDSKVKRVSAKCCSVDGPCLHKW